MSDVLESDADRAIVELPSGWAWLPVEDLAANESGALTDGPFGSNLKTSHYTLNGPRVIRLQNIGDGIFRDEKAHIAQEHFARLRKHEARTQDVVVAMLGENLPRACVVPDYVGPAVVKADCARLRVDPNVALPALVAAGLNSELVRRQADQLVHGVGRPRLGLRLLKMLQFPLPPVREQQRIVEAIDTYFTRLDDAVATLERIQRNLTRYRASVLKAAVEGRLVPTEAEQGRAERRVYEPASALLERILAERRRRWQEAGGRDKYREPALPDASDLPQLPDGWCWATVDQLSCEVQYGSSAKAHEEQDGGVPVVRMGNIVDGILDLTDLKYLPANHDEFPDLLLQPGDLLFNRTNSAELVGKTAVFRNYGQPCSFASYLIRVRMLRGAHPDFVSHYINSLVGRAWIASVVSQQVGQANVNGTKLRACPVPLPPEEEQRRIVGEVDRLLSVAVVATEATATDHQRCERLRQAILKWAFEGKLADQDPSDEPVSVLLERIRTETAARAASVATERRPKRRRRKGRMSGSKNTK